MVTPSDSAFPKRRESQASPSAVEPEFAASEPGRQQALPLVGGEPASQDQATAPVLSAMERRSPIWLCIRLPWLAFEALGESREARRPLAVVSEEGGHPIVHLAGRYAMALGVQPGQTLNTALALVPGLEVLPREPRREQEALEALGGWVGRFSPLVSLEPPQCLLLEVRGSLRLFRGLKRLRRLVADGLSRQGHGARLVAAPTPLAALWLSHGKEVLVRDVTDLPRHLNPMGLRVTGWPEKTLKSLDGIGVQTIGQCRRLPREGFARRFGPECLQALDRALGHCPDPRSHFLVPVRFSDQLDLLEESLDEDLLMQACRHLLVKLEDFLQRHQLAAPRLRFRFSHFRRGVTTLMLGFSEPGRDVSHWESLLRSRLERLRLPAPVIAIGLVTGRLVPQRTKTKALPLLESGHGAAMATPLQLVESLRARLGDGAVLGLRMLSEHRPHQAWGSVDPLRDRAGTASTGLSPWWRLEEVPAEIEALRCSGSLSLQRPLWMLTVAQALETRDGQPCHAGPLDILSGPERIETGWWDGIDTARDYYIAETREGIRLWIYQDRRSPAGWYLQGIFG